MWRVIVSTTGEHGFILSTDGEKVEKFFLKPSDTVAGEMPSVGQGLAFYVEPKSTPTHQYDRAVNVRVVTREERAA
jgi:hypothetical protein